MWGIVLSTLVIICPARTAQAVQDRVLAKCLVALIPRNPAFVLIWTQLPPEPVRFASIRSKIASVEQLAEVSMALQNPIPQLTPTALDNVASSRHAEEVVRRARQELQSLKNQRAEIMKRIGTVKQTILGLAAIFDGLVPEDELLDLNGKKAPGHQTGLTKGCRLVLMQSPDPLRPRDVSERLMQHGVSLEKHKDPLASVTTILNRLVHYGEARLVDRPDGRRAFAWVNQPLQS
jgi:hypothetical protein